MKLLKSALTALYVSVVGCSPADDQPSQLALQAPWPERDGNYLRLHQSTNGQWFLSGAVVRSGKTATALYKVERPADPSSLLSQHIPLASIHVRGVDCESLAFKHLFLDQHTYVEAYWMAVPRGITRAKPSCQIKNPPEKWQFVEGD